MAPPLNTEQDKLLKRIYYNQKMFFGRDKIFQYIRSNHPESKISRRQVLDWLQKQEVYQRNVIPPTQKSTKPVDTVKQGYIQIDLVDMSAYKERNFNFIMTSIDVFSRKANAIPITQKSGPVITKALSKLLAVYDKVSVIQSDNGSEFLNPSFKSYLDSRNIKHITSKAYTPQSQGKVERFNGTLKRMIFQNMTATNKRLWVSNIPVFIKNYNSTKHRIVEKTPDDIEDNDNEVIDKINNKRNKNIQNTRLKEYKVGDSVRVILKKGKLDKKSYNTYTKAVYVIYKVFKAKKPFLLDTYKLMDEDGDLIEGTYNPTQLQIV